MICSSWLNYKKEQQFVQQQQHLSCDLGSDGESPDDQLIDAPPPTELSSDQQSDLHASEEHLHVPAHITSQTGHRTTSSSGMWSGNSSLVSHTPFDTPEFVYSYIDVEKLIMAHLRTRIQQLNDVGIVDTALFDSTTDIHSSTGIGSKSLSHHQLSPPLTEMSDSNTKCDTTNHLPSLKPNHYQLPIGPTLVGQPTSHSTASPTPLVTVTSTTKTGGIMKKRRPNALDPDSESNGITSNANRMRSSVLGPSRPNEPHWMTFLRVCEEDFERYHSQQVADSLQTSALKENLVSYANCVTNNWVFGLIQREIETRNRTLWSTFEQRCFESTLGEERANSIRPKSLVRCRMNCRRSACQRMHLPETVYIVNLVPNQINVFRHCLFLKQMPNLHAFRVNFIGVNLIRNDFRKKDLDMIANHSLYDEVNYAYIAHFRQLNRLVDIRIEQFMQKVRVRLIRSKAAIQIREPNDLRSLLGPLEATVEIDISQLAMPSPSITKSKLILENGASKRSGLSREMKDTLDDSAQQTGERGNLLFLVDDKIDIGDFILCVEDRSLTMSAIRHFVQTYLKFKEANTI